MIKPPYSIEEHRHRFAAWAASRAASASSLCRFKVKDGFFLLESIGFKSSFELKNLPEPKEFDEEHSKWREGLIEKAQSVEKVEIKDKKRKTKLTLTHGVAAKLINCYLKARFVCAGFQDESKVQAIHPPIDSLLLKEFASTLKVASKKEELRKLGCWSAFDSNKYQNAIRLIRDHVDGKPLWTIEEHWVGHRDKEDEQVIF